MQFSKNTSTGNNKIFLIKIILVLIFITSCETLKIPQSKNLQKSETFLTGDCIKGFGTSNLKEHKYRGNFKNGKFKIISFYAKKARGMMSRFIIENQIDDPEKIKSFISGGYLFDQAMSTPNEWVFTRKTME